MAWQYIPTTTLAPAEVAVGLLLPDEEGEPLVHGLGVPALDVGIAGAQVGEQGQARQRRVGLPVGARARADLVARGNAR